MPIAPSDWRLLGDLDWLKGKAWRLAPYRAPRKDWTHDHCTFCWATFTEGGINSALAEGYTTDDDLWVCATCFEDFRERFNWARNLL